jgi:hypothetical protein
MPERRSSNSVPSLRRQPGDRVRGPSFELLGASGRFHLLVKESLEPHSAKVHAITLKGVPLRGRLSTPAKWWPAGWHQEALHPLGGVG